MRGGFDPYQSARRGGHGSQAISRWFVHARAGAFSGKVDFRFSEENATTQRNLERVSAQIESTGAVRAPVRDPEKWSPVFGEDHAQTKT
jgi:hypothetical protein